MSKKLTIGLFNDSFYPMADGVIMVVDNYARRLSKIANVIVFVPEYKQKYDYSIFPYKVVRCKSVKIPFLDYSLPLPKIDKKFQKELEQYNLDIVHIHAPFTMGSVGLSYAKKHNIPCVATMHSQFKQDFQKAVKFDWASTLLNNTLIRKFNKCDECWAVTDETARIFYEDYHCKVMPKVMENGTDMLPVKNVKEANDYINKKHNLDPKEKVFIFVGRINTLKNILFIADSIKELINIDPKLKFKMLFVGSGQDEVLLRKRIDELKINDYTILCGKVTDREELAKYYQRSDLLIFPSKYDTSSLVRIEAASQKTPGIFLIGTSTAMTVTDNVNGYVCEENPKVYAKRIKDILDDKKLYQKVAENAYKDLYVNWDDQVKEVYKLYQKIIDKKKN